VRAVHPILTRRRIFRAEHDWLEAAVTKIQPTLAADATTHQPLDHRSIGSGKIERRQIGPQNPTKGTPRLAPFATQMALYKVKLDRCVVVVVDDYPNRRLSKDGQPGFLEAFASRCRPDRFFWPHFPTGKLGLSRKRHIARALTHEESPFVLNDRDSNLRRHGVETTLAPF
jgi:hypothetical protein